MSAARFPHALSGFPPALSKGSPHTLSLSKGVRPGRQLTSIALAALLAAACAGPRASGTARSTREALAALAEGGDLAAAGRALAARPPRDAWAHLGRSLLARRALDGEGEARALLAAVAAAPGEPMALVAIRRLSELSEEAPALAEQVEAGLAPLLAAGRLPGPAAYRARAARAIAAEVLGDHAAVARHRAENGAVSAWTIAGPFALLHALDFDAPIPPEAGLIPVSVPAAAGLPPAPTRNLPAPDGTVALDGEPGGADVYALASDVTLSRGGRYLVALGTQMSARLSVDGAPVYERRGFSGFPPTLVHLPLELAAGRHRLVLKISRGGARPGLHVAFARADGAPSDASFRSPGPTTTAASARAEPVEGRGAAPVTNDPTPTAAHPIPPTAPVLGARALATALEPAAGPVLARLLAARDAMAGDREAAKVLIAEAMAQRPASAALHVALAAVRRDDPTLDDGVAAGRAEAALREALRLDAGHAEARVALAVQLRAAERLDDADEVLAGLAAPAAPRPAALVARARSARDRGLLERAEGLAGEATAAGGSCDAAEVAADLADRRDAIAREDETAGLLARCRGGRERLAGHLRRRGDPAGAVAALEPLVAARPWALDPGLARAEALVAEGQPARAAERLGTLATLWPRNTRVLKALADARELSGDRAGAREARERALLLDGADLPLRRALALEDGRDVLDDLAEDAGAAIRAYEAAGRRAGTASAMVLDAAAVEIHPGGAATERTHQVTHVLDQGGVEELGEVSIPPGADVIALRTLKPDGRALEPERAGSGKGTVSLAGLEPGDYVEVEYVRAVRGPHAAAGYAADPFYFQIPGSRLFRSVYVVRAPPGLGLAADAHGMPAPAVAREGEGELVRAERNDVPAFVPEPSGPGGREFLPFLAVGTGGGREALQRGVADALLERTRPTEEVRAFAREVRAAAGPGAAPLALARAAYARVAKAVLGEGGALGEDASAVLSRGRGNRLAVLKAVLSELGLQARFALARPFTADPAPYRFPTLELYAAPLLRVETGGGTIWLDPSQRMMPFGALPSALSGCEALILPEPGEPAAVDRTPERAAAAEGREIALRVALAADGGAELTGTDRYAGGAGAALKAVLERLDGAERRQAIESSLARYFRGIAVSELAFSGEDDPDAPLEIRWRARAPLLARPADGGLVVEAPLFPAQLGGRYVETAARTTPLLVPGVERLSQRVELVPPPELRAAASPSRRVETPFGTYTRAERVEGETLVREERLEVARARIAPAQYLEFAGFAAKVDALQEEPVRLTR